MFLDIGVGILSSIFISWFFNLPLTFLLIIGGIVFALLMDVDFLFYVFQGKEVYRHRDLFHYPLIYLPLGTVLLYFFVGISWAALFFLASLSHFLHDSIGLGFGVQWLWPFSRDRYTFFYLFQPHSRAQLPFKFIYIWRAGQFDEINKKLGDPDWFKNIYLNWHPFAVIEYLVFIISIVALYFYVGK
ncbi:hypothetical protein A2Z53_02565 [Candidatus Giovannonibacteria bacterium RIFCSPHIGHO2_02_42_15]|uniref:Metal-dependent hydrolase n=2 Tax=Candidatus Giovannoniibacteriota TaxID=1752738 RepID=A0A1F5VMJ9_9BACT|nr:MAG: hypothetical protein UV11_C0016G0011 [Candidatus Giovannonibacteria bacterium GW2011_GWF2_42_19]OGF64609.1 MAG: hypothetical protein A2Z53_02565 [Candidatus Giovannonibacteria bacterium RIFCSPHIGHO2_02_42_15]